MKHVFGEYAAFHTPGGIRFMRGAKLVSEKSLPPEVVAYLKNKLGEETPNIQPPENSTQVPVKMPTEEEKQKLREESLQVKPELQAAPEKLEEDRLSAEDFPTPEINLDPLAPAEVPEKTPPQPGDKVPGKNAEVVSSDFLESVSIHTAPLEAIAEAIYNRFGIYTVWLRQLPKNDEINPLTGEGFTKYHLGIAYQAAIRAQHRGLLDLDPESNRKKLDQNRAAHENVRMDEAPVTLREHRQSNTFDYRTSPMGNRSTSDTEIVHEEKDGQVRAVQKTINGIPSETGLKNGANVTFDRDEDEPLVQPNFSGKPIIRPDW